MRQGEEIFIGLWLGNEAIGSMLYPSWTEIERHTLSESVIDLTGHKWINCKIAVTKNSSCHPAETVAAWSPRMKWLHRTGTLQYRESEWTLHNQRLWLLPDKSKS